MEQLLKILEDNARMSVEDIAAMLEALDAGLPDGPRGLEVRLADAEADALGHISGQIKEFADAGGAHLPCGRRDQFIVVHHSTVHSLSSISSS